MTAAHLLLAKWIDIPTAWIIAWAVLAVLTIVLGVLLRTRLRNMKPWQKCALLSLWVHVLLGCLIASVQIATSGPGVGDGYGPAIQVALLSADVESLAQPGDLLQAPVVEAASDNPESAASLQDSSDDEQPAATTDDPQREAQPEPSAADLAPPELLAQPEPPAEEGPTETTVEAAAPAEPFEQTGVAEPEPEPEPPAPASPSDPQPPLPPVESAPLEEPAAAAAAAPAAAEAQPLCEAPPADSATETSSEAHHADRSASPPAASSDSGAPPAPAGAPVAPSQLPSPYAARFAPNRQAVAESGGGGANTERAVAAGLAWLAAAQEADGRWNPKRHGAGRELYVLQQNRSGAGAQADTGISSLALLAYLGAGQTHRHGPYALTVGQGLEFLRRSQAADGNLYGDAELFARTYCHAMSTFALSEAFAITQDQRLLPTVRAAANYSVATQHPTDGGWRYRPGDAGDTSQLGWQVMALRSAEEGGLQIPAVTWTRVDRFLRQVVRGQFGGLAVYRPEEARPSRSMTAEALYCRQLVTGRADGGLHPDALAEAIGSLVEEPPSQRAVNLYYWYYATLALHRAQHTSPEAAAGWRTWNDALTQTLLATQREDGCWPETCLWGGYGGRVYTTALATMCLEIYYRYAPNDAAPPARTTPDVARQNTWNSAAPR